jgi:hypothetical protein
MSNDSDAPFDLTQLRRIYYRLDEVGIKSCSEKLTDMLRRTPGPDEFDSPVFEALPFLTVGQSGRSLRRDPRRPKFPLLARPDRSAGIIPGELRDVNHVDVWVNSENTQFEMARFGERAISSTIRALGSSKRQNEKGETKYGDEVNVDLQAAKQRVAPKQTHVPEAEAVLTPPRALSGSEHNVRQIAHVAAVKSEPGLGFDPVGNLGLCVKKVVAEIARYNRRWFASRDRKLRHVLFPLLATGQAMQSPQVVVPPLIDAAIEALEASHDNHLKAVYFLARTDVDFDLLDRQLRIRSDKLKVS